MEQNIEKIIDDIVWWIPFKKLRNNVRNYLIYLANIQNNNYSNNKTNNIIKIDSNNRFNLIRLNKRYDFDRNIAIYFDSGIGDYLMLRPFLPFIREYYKNDKITFIGNNRFLDIVLFFDKDYIDEYIYYEGNSNYKNIIAKDFFKDLYYDILISHYYLRGTWFDEAIKIINAKEKIANYGGTLDISNTERIDVSAYTKIIYPSNNVMFELYRNIEFFSKLFEQEIKITNINFDLKNEDFENVDFNYNHKYAIILPNSVGEFKIWHWRKFQYVADHLYNKYGIICYVIGAKEEESLANKIIEDRKYIISLCGKYKLYELFYIFNRAALIVTNDSGGYHIGIMSGAKNIVVVSSGGAYIRFVNYPKEYTNNTIISKPLPKNALEHPYAEYYVSDLHVNSISEEYVCKLIDDEHGKYLIDN